MATKVAINGFGRIGRAVARVILERAGELELVAINDLADPKALAHLFKYDTVMGKWGGTVGVSDSGLVIDGKDIKVTAVRNPAELPWGELGVDIVLESTGIFREKSSPKGGYGDHIKAGAKKVVLSVPSKDKIDATVVMGVNEEALTADVETASNASCTTNCLAPVAKVLNDAFGIKRGLMTTVHAYTNDQVVSDMIHSDMRRARAAADNIIPTTTGAAVAVGKVIPELNGKLDGFALRVPVIDGSCVDLSVEFEKDVTVEEINAAIKAAAEGPMKGVLAYCDEPIVSSDIVGDPHSSIFDAMSTMVMGGNFAKIVSWYDNEWGYSNRAVDLMEKMVPML
ncbi:MAG: type I glyceraldehyde-3-phosphate dehydrogenase [Sedimentisphaeraceae bacterium JB056]